MEGELIMAEVEILFTVPSDYSVIVNLSKVAEATNLTIRELRTAIEDGDYEPFAEYVSDNPGAWDLQSQGDPEIEDVSAP